LTASQATGSGSLASIENTVAKIPGGRGIIADRAQQQIDAIDRYIASLSRTLANGRSPDPEVAGRTVQGRAYDRGGFSGEGGFVDRFKARAGKLYDAIPIAREERVSAATTLEWLKKATTPIEGAENISETALLKNNAIFEIRDALAKDVAKSNSGDVLPFGALQELRSRIGTKLTSPDLVNDIPRGELKQLYAALTRDLEIAAENAGPQAKAAYDRASNYYRAGIKRIDDVIEGLANKTEPEKVITAIEAATRRGGTTTRAVMRSLTKPERDLVAASILQRMGRASPGAQDAEGSVFSAETFLTNWNKMTKEGKDALFGGSSYRGLRSDLDAVARTAARIRSSSNILKNPSGTSAAVTAAAVAGGGAAGVSQMFIEPLSALAVLGTTGVIIGGANATSRLMTSPSFVKWLAEGTRVKPNGVGGHIGRLSSIAASSDPETREAIKAYLSTLATPVAPSE